VAGRAIVEPVETLVHPGTTGVTAGDRHVHRRSRGAFGARLTRDDVTLAIGASCQAGAADCPAFPVPIV
jgi:hypothetical protein